MLYENSEARQPEMKQTLGCMQATDGSIVSAYVREAVRRAEEERPGAHSVTDIASCQMPTGCVMPFY